MTQFSVKPNTYIYLTILLLILPIKWLFAWITAILFHEFCHWIAVKICGGEILHLKIGLGGAQMQCTNMPEKCRLLAILCGPIGGFALTCLGRWIPRIAICSFLLSIYNLLPLIPLDGGFALRVIIKSDKAFCFMHKIILIVIAILALYTAFILRLGVLPLAVALGIYLKYRNYSCKESVCGVQ